MKLPTTEQLDQAIAWLEHSNEHASKRTTEACKAVAEYLEHMDNERTIREAARHDHTASGRR